MLDYISGATSHNTINGGLKHLTEIALPRKSFVTASGFKVSTLGFKVTLSLGLYFSEYARDAKIFSEVLFAGCLGSTEQSLMEKDLKPFFD